MPARLVALVLFAGLVCGSLGASSRAAQAEDAASQKYTAAELKELVAPVALYPDVVLSSMLPASTVPKDVVAAAAYVAAQGGKVESVPEGNGWDKSVQAMLQFPDVLTWMKDNGTWMEQMAFALAVQQAEVLKAIQDFRVEVQKAGNLTSDEHQTVEVTEQGSTEVIVIQPTNPQVVYVPTYQPTAVVQPGYAGYGWAWGFAAGATASWAYHNISWGGNDYNGASITVNNNVTNNIGNSVGSNNAIGPNRPTTWNSANAAAARPQGAVRPPTQLPAQRPGATPGQRPAGSGVRPPASGAQRPSTPQRPSTQPGGLGGSRPTPTPSVPGTAQRPGGASGASGAGGAATRPASPPAKPSSGFSGAGQSGAQARAQSQRGGSSLQGSTGGGSFQGHARSGGGSGGGGGGGGKRR